MSRTRRLLPLLSLLALSGCGTRAEPEPYTIGQLVTLTDPNKAAGEHARNGARLAIEAALRGDRQVLGRKVAVRHVDVRGDQELVQADAVRLLTLNRVFGLLGGPDATLSEPLMKVARNYPQPLLLTADVANLPAGVPVYCLNASPEARGVALARFAARDLHARHVAVLTDGRQAVASALADAFVKQWRTDQHDNTDATVDEWPYRPEAEWADLVRRATDAKVDGLVLALGASDVLKFRTKLEAAGWKKPLLYGGEDRGTAPFDALGKEGPAVYLATAFAADADLGAEGKRFVEEYEAQFHEPPGLAAALAYDGVGVLVDALAKAKGPQPAAVSAELAARTDYPGVTGPLSLAGQRARRRLFVIRVEAGVKKPAATFDP